MNRSTKFINDIFIYAIGNLGSKLITFLLVIHIIYPPMILDIMILS